VDLMKSMALVALLACTSAALAADPFYVDSSTRPVLRDGDGVITVTSTPVDIFGDAPAPHGGSSGPPPGNGDIYNNVPGPYSAFPAGTGSIGIDDYVTAYNTVNGVHRLDAFGFVGGCTNVGGGIIDFNFFTGTIATPVFFNGFSVTLPQATSSFTITFNAGQTPGMDVPNAGIVNLVARAASGATPACTGRWFLTPTAPTVGSSDPGVGGASPGNVTFNHAMRMSVPEPATLGLLAIGGLLAIRRRRNA